MNENGIGESSGGYAVHLVKSMLSFSNLGGVPKNILPIRNPSLSSVFAKPILVQAAGTSSKTIQSVHLVISFSSSPSLSNSTMPPLELTIPICKSSRVML
ncbi:hypothetical protein ALC56_04418 [Trachymyrmex septentrionalis]|uniref:Uncharacterized protein n=1 Tax=Trachymyrmex septentrionalis TaxID=34720 RepID=A0A195FLY7_9HYME|nr:hypothetical protein ALC56_04418 [Trachymyrmex septentrionalis]